MYRTYEIVKKINIERYITKKTGEFHEK